MKKQVLLSATAFVGVITIISLALKNTGHSSNLDGDADLDKFDFSPDSTIVLFDIT
jgi:hypothetical protein